MRRYILYIILLLCSGIGFSLNANISLVTSVIPYGVNGGYLDDSGNIFFSQRDYLENESDFYEKLYTWDEASRTNNLLFDTTVLFENKTIREYCSIDLVWRIENFLFIIVLYYDLDLNQYQRIECRIDLDGNIIDCETIDRNESNRYRFQSSEDRKMFYHSNLQEVWFYYFGDQSQKIIPLNRYFTRTFAIDPYSETMYFYDGTENEFNIIRYNYIHNALVEQFPISTDFIEEENFCVSTIHYSQDLNGLICCDDFNGIFFYDLETHDFTHLYEINYYEDYNECYVFDVLNNRVLFLVANEQSSLYELVIEK